MLVLTRYPNQTIWLEPGHIKVTVVSVRADGQVRLAFDAPKSVTILREEVVGKHEHLRHQAELEAKKRRAWDADYEDA